MPTKKSTWIITTSDERPIRAIAKDLQAAGLESAKVQKEIGVITGEATREAAAKLRKVQGVVDVAPDHEIDIGPPDSDETW